MGKAWCQTMKPIFLHLLASVLLSLLPGVASAELKLGRDYIQIAPQPTEVQGRVEVTEFFWYGCPHCYALEPVLNRWLKTLSSDVNFRRVPALFPSGKWAPGARLYYALEALGAESRLRGALFDAIHTDALNYTDETEMADWLAKQGVERAAFSSVYRSEAVEGKVRQALELTQAHAVRGVPTVVVAGKYLTSNTMAGSDDALPGVIDRLIALARAESARGR